MAECRYHYVCGRDADENAGDGLCILHSESLDKDKNTFGEALEMHRRKKGDNFSHFVFPTDADFGQVEFKEASFFGAKFNKSANFIRATFAGIADFRCVTFSEEGAFFRSAKFIDAHFEEVNFRCCPDLMDAQFTGEAQFSRATFAKGVNLNRGIFNEEVRFRNSTFIGRILFTDVRFRGGADFFDATFKGRPDFLGATFDQDADFIWAKFSRGARFAKAKFAKLADFGLTTFAGDADFGATEFTEGADFHGVTFAKGANFIDTKFAGAAKFYSSQFLGRMFFASNHKNLPIFSGVETDFRSVYIDPLDALRIRDADLRNCRFQGTDMRKTEITAAIWPRIRGRFSVYDEIAPLRDGEGRSWDHIERLYRELKQNYEDRRDYERAGDFHYGEKEMRLKNPETPWPLKVPLWLYRLVSGYGERCLPPLMWALGLLVAFTFCYLEWDLLHFKTKGPVTDPVVHWWDAGLYSLRVMTLLKPSDFELVRFWGDLINLAQSLLGPLLLGLFALALRQRLKR